MISCVVVAAVGVGLTAEAWSLIETQAILKSPAMRMPMSWLYAISLIGFVSTILRASVAAVQYAVRRRPASRRTTTARRHRSNERLDPLSPDHARCCVIRVPIAFAFFGPCLLYLLTTDQSLGLALRLVAQLDRELPAAGGPPVHPARDCIANHAGIADRLFDFALALLGRVRGSLGYVSVGVSLGFSWMSGSAVADAAALGKVEIPAMLRSGYSKPFALGVVGAVVADRAGDAAEHPGGHLRRARRGLDRRALRGVGGPGSPDGPRAVRRGLPLGAPRCPTSSAPQFSGARVWETGKRVIAPLGAPVIILGGILGGFFTPTEAAAVGAAYMAVLGFAYRTLTIRDLPEGPHRGGRSPPARSC